MQAHMISGDDSVNCMRLTENVVTMEGKFWQVNNFGSPFLISVNETLNKIFDPASA